MPEPEREPGPEPTVLTMEAVDAAARDDLTALARSRLLASGWRAGHRAGFARGAVWAAWFLGASAGRRRGDGGIDGARGTLDEIRARRYVPRPGGSRWT